LNREIRERMLIDSIRCGADEKPNHNFEKSVNL
jgi:hypothetical protein